MEAVSPPNLAPARAFVYGPIDWWRVIVDLEAYSYSHGNIAGAVGSARTTVIGWKNLGAEPGHSAGQRLLVLWSGVTGREIEKAPRTLPVLSAAAFR